MKTARSSLQKPVRIIVADDHVLVREGIRKVLALDHFIEILAEAASASELLEHLSVIHADLLLLDLVMPGVKQMELLEKVLRTTPSTPVLVLSMHSEPHVARQAIRLGARGYLTKDSSPDILIDAILRVAAGELFVDPSLSSSLYLSKTSPQTDPLDRLSLRERAVLISLANGEAIIEIARKMGVSPNTVSTYKVRLMEKLEQRTLSDLIRFALHHGLVA